MINKIERDCNLLICITMFGQINKLHWAIHFWTDNVYKTECKEQHKTCSFLYVSTVHQLMICGSTHFIIWLYLHTKVQGLRFFYSPHTQLYRI